MSLCPWFLPLIFIPRVHRGRHSVFHSISCIGVLFTHACRCGVAVCSRVNCFRTIVFFFSRFGMLQVFKSVEAFVSFVIQLLLLLASVACLCFRIIIRLYGEVCVCVCVCTLDMTTRVVKVLVP